MSIYADIILPLALPKRTYTYGVPEALVPYLQPGVRVEVQFGRSKLYSGLIEKLHTKKPEYALKNIIAVLDEVTIVSEQQLRLWDWMADYYCCSLGEVMAAALPGHLKLTSETRLVFNPSFGEDFSDFSDEEYLIAEALLIQKEITIDDARKILNKKSVFPIIQQLLNLGVLHLREDLQEKFKPRKVTGIRLSAALKDNPEALRQCMTVLSKKERQLEIIMAFLTLEKQQPYVLKQTLLNKADISDGSLNTLLKKGILEKYDVNISRMGGYEDEIAAVETLTAQQTRALDELQQVFESKNVALLYGVTGSGKTRVYVERIREVVRQGGQVLYLLPEIALTTQIIQRLKKVFGEDIAVYHSKINTQERVEVWRAAAAGKPVVLAARSGLFLPFKDLKLVIVDEEHDPSYKQYDPDPRYHARDAAIFLASLYGAKTLLGTATPSLETWYNALTGKFGLIEMPERFGDVQMPEIKTVDLREQAKTKQMQSIFSKPLLEHISAALSADQQVILFQNRRGYAPMLECSVCDWHAECRHCDISLTYHMQTRRLRCHLCGYAQDMVEICPACGSGKVILRGFGTEKIEDELKIFLPNARIGRMDLDTAGTKNKLTELLNDFEEKRLDILVGTQMVTKGLDFEHVALVGVLGADSLTSYPDFRAGERAFQLLTQVAGRAGRRNQRGKVLIQAWNPDHPVVKDVLTHDFNNFAKRELAERKEFHYPPFYRLIHLEIRHKDPKVVTAAAASMAKMLRAKLGDRVLGPVIPNVARVRGYYGQDIMLKLEKSAPLLADAKGLIRYNTEILVSRQGWSQLQIDVDVDPV